MENVLVTKELYEPLKLFNEKAQKLQNLSFIKQYEETKNALTITATKEAEPDTFNIEIDSNRANDESIDAVSLTLRFFIQDNEKCSFRNLSKLYEKMEPVAGFKQEYEIYRSYLNDFLNQETQPQPKINEFERPLLFRDVLEVFMYGGLSHANEKKKVIYDRWMSEQVSCAAYTHIFHSIVSEMIKITSAISEINNMVILKLSSITQPRPYKAIKSDS